MKTTLLRARARASGFTLLELLISVGVLGVLMGSLALIGRASDRAYRTGATQAHLEERIAATTQRIVLDLRIAADDSLSPDPVAGTGASAIQYVQAVGLAGSDVVWSDLRRLAFEYEPGEVDDGVDNDGNGLVDDGRVVLTEDFGGAGERRLVLSRWVREHLAGEVANGLDDNGNGLVDEPGFLVEREGETLRIRLTLERSDAEGRLLQRTGRTSTRLRN